MATTTTTTTNTDAESTELPTGDNVQTTGNEESVVSLAPTASTFSTATTITVEATVAKLKIAESTINELLGLNSRTKTMLGKKLHEVNKILMDIPEDQITVSELWQEKVSTWWRQYLGTPMLDQNKWKPSMNDRWSPSSHYPPGGAARFPGAFSTGQLSSYRPPWHQPTTSKRHVWLRLGNRGCRPNFNPSNAESSNPELMVSFPSGDLAETSRPALLGLQPSANSWTSVNSNKRPHSPEPADDDEGKNSAHCSRKRFERSNSSSPEYGDDEDEEYVPRGFKLLPKLTEESPKTDNTCVLCRRDSHCIKDCPGVSIDLCDNCFTEGHTSANCTENIDANGQAAQTPLNNDSSSD